MKKSIHETPDNYSIKPIIDYNFFIFQIYVVQLEL